MASAIGKNGVSGSSEPIFVLIDAFDATSVAFRMILKRHFTPERVWEVDVDSPSYKVGGRSFDELRSEWNSMQVEKREGIKLIVGNVPYGIHQITGREGKYMTVVNRGRGTADGSASSTDHEWTNGGAVERSSASILSELLMGEDLGGLAGDRGNQSDIGKATERVRRNFVWTGVYEKFDQSLVLLSDELDIPLWTMRYRYAIRKSGFKKGRRESEADDPDGNVGLEAHLYSVCEESNEEKIRRSEKSFHLRLVYFRIINWLYNCVWFPAVLVRSTARMLKSACTGAKGWIVSGWRGIQVWFAGRQVTSAERNPLLAKLTLVIPTHDRHDYLTRVIDYYGNWSANVIVVDSTEERYGGRLGDSIRYLHRPGIPFGTKLAGVLEGVTSPLVLLAADDDFISPVGVVEAATYMLEHSECACAQGWHAGFFRCNTGRVDWYALHIFAKDYRVDAADAQGRVSQQAARYMNNFYSLHRTEVLQHFFCRIYPNLNGEILKGRPDLLEVAQAICSVVWGSHVILPVFWIARESIADSAGGAPAIADEGGGDADAKIIFDEMESSLSETLGTASGNILFDDALESFKRYRIEWESGEIDHLADLEEVIGSPRDRAVISKIASNIQQHPFLN